MIEIPIWIILTLMPIIVLIWRGFQYDDYQSQFGSSRGWYFIFCTPIALFISSLIALVYWIGVAKGWWNN